MTEIEKEYTPTIEASAHCDGPCGVYDPASARVAAEAVQSMTKKMLALMNDEAMANPQNVMTLARYSAIKEEESQ